VDLRTKSGLLQLSCLERIQQKLRQRKRRHQMGFCAASACLRENELEGFGCARTDFILTYARHVLEAISSRASNTVDHHQA
jgi:hypothetical protein